MKLTLYGTEFCHLCEQAETVLQQLGLVAQHIDIAEQDDLYELYGTRIPVLQRNDNLAELGWPFDVNSVATFLTAAT